MRFLGADSEIALDRNHREFAEWRWMAPDEIVQHIVPFKRSVYEAVFASFAAPLATLRGQG